MNKDPEIPKLVHNISNIIFDLEKLGSEHSNEIRMLHDLRVKLVMQFNGDKNNDRK